MADRLAVVTAGRIVAEGRPAALRDRYGTDATVERTEPDGAPRTERTRTPTRTVAELMRRFDGEIPGLSVSRHYLTAAAAGGVRGGGRHQPRAGAGLGAAVVARGRSRYPLKDLPRGDLARAVRAAARGETVLAARLVDQLRTKPERPGLSERETAVPRPVA